MKLIDSFVRKLIYVQMDASFCKINFDFNAFDNKINFGPCYICGVFVPHYRDDVELCEKCDLHDMISISSYCSFLDNNKFTTGYNGAQRKNL